MLLGLFKNVKFKLDARKAIITPLPSLKLCLSSFSRRTQGLSKVKNPPHPVCKNRPCKHGGWFGVFLDKWLIIALIA